ncbi:hypothetical protein KPL74_09240 [Bacillus sp. NP157]|nr:hypothetical protein KPL74_09240 [Bacillus sp. NP157]
MPDVPFGEVGMLRKFPRALIIPALLATGIVAGACLAYAAPDRPLDERIRDAEVVFTGTVTRVDPNPDRRGFLEVATLDVKTVLKGQVGRSVRLGTADTVVEMSPNCCVIGHTYLVIGQASGEPGLIRAVDGPNGVFDVAPDAKKGEALAWPGSP